MSVVTDPNVRHLCKAVGCPHGVIWHYQRIDTGAYEYQVVRYDRSHNTILGTFAFASAAIDLYRREVEGGAS